MCQDSSRGTFYKAQGTLPNIPFFFFLNGHTCGIWKFPGWCRIGAAATNLCQSHSHAGSLTHWARPGMEPMASGISAGFVTAEPWWGAPTQHTVITSMGKNPKQNGCVYACNRITLLYTWNQYNIVTQLCFNQISKNEKKQCLYFTQSPWSIYTYIWSNKNVSPSLEFASWRDGNALD